MDIQYYSDGRGNKRNNLKRRIKGIILILVIILVAAGIIGILTDDNAEYKMRQSTIEENHVLKEQVEMLTEEVETLKAQLAQRDEAAETPSPAPDGEASGDAEPSAAPTAAPTRDPSAKPTTIR